MCVSRLCCGGGGGGDAKTRLVSMDREQERERRRRGDAFLSFQAEARRRGVVFGVVCGGADGGAGGGDTKPREKWSTESLNTGSCWRLPPHEGPDSHLPCFQII